MSNIKKDKYQPFLGGELPATDYRNPATKYRNMTRIYMLDFGLFSIFFFGALYLALNPILIYTFNIMLIFALLILGVATRFMIHGHASLLVKKISLHHLQKLPCEKCKTPLQEKWKMCPYCGTPKLGLHLLIDQPHYWGM